MFNYTEIEDNPIVDLTIYHIPGIKVGCTENFDKRSWINHRTHGQDKEIEILCSGKMTIEAASDLEFMFADEFGYKRHARYANVYRQAKIPERNQKVHEARDGHEVTPETRAAISKGSNQRYKNQEEYHKLSEAAKKRGRNIAYVVSINGIEYPNAVIASEAINMNKSTLTYRCRSQRYPNFFYTEVVTPPKNSLTEEESSIRNLKVEKRRKNKEVTINGVVFKNRVTAAEYLNCQPSTITSRINRGKKGYFG